MNIVDRPLVSARKVPKFRKGASVAFRAYDGTVIPGVYVGSDSPRNVGPRYHIQVDGSLYVIGAQSPVGRSLTVQQS